MARPTKIGPGNILDAAERALLVEGCGSLALDTVAKAAGCAKGLVHYHFETRTKLLVAANDRLWDKRQRSWEAALAGPALERCIRETWTLLLREATEGVTRARLSLLVDSDRALGAAARRSTERFDAAFHASSRALLDRLDLAPSIAPDEWSRLLLAGVDGVALQLIGGRPASSVETDYAAVWLAALGLTKPRDA